jgi:hypothetical protein
MKFPRVEVEQLLAEFTNLQSDWMDEEARAVASRIPFVVQQVRALGADITQKPLAALLGAEPLALDVFRLLAGEGQETMAHRICDVLDGNRRGWTALRSLARRNPDTVATALLALGIKDIVLDQVLRKWTIEDVLLDRYKLGRGRAIAGQSRGRALENDVEQVLKSVDVPFDMRVTFTGASGVTAKCDFAIPNRDNPLIVIEAKGYEATGSKLTDFLGDVLKIKQAKGYHTYVLVMTDGRGWFNRQSDLKRLVDLHHDGTIEMIYTRARLQQLAADIAQIWRTER